MDAQPVSSYHATSSAVVSPIELLACPEILSTGSKAELFFGCIPSAPAIHVRLTQQIGFPGPAWVGIPPGHSLHRKQEQCWTFMEQFF